MNGVNPRDVLRRQCLLDDDEATLPDGTVVGIGLLLEQWRDLTPHVDPEVLLQIVQLVRSDEDAPGPREPFTLRWLREGSRLGRLEGRARQQLFRRALPNDDADLVGELVGELARAKRFCGAAGNGGAP